MLHGEQGHAGAAHYHLDLKSNRGEIHLPDISASADESDHISTRTNTLTPLHDTSTLAHEVGHKILTPIRLRKDVASYAQYIEGKLTSIDLANRKRAVLQTEENIAVIIENLARRELGYPLRYPEYEGGHTKRLINLGTDSLGDAARQFLAHRHGQWLDAVLSSTRIDPKRLMVLDASTQRLRPLGADEYLSFKPLNETRRLPHAVTLNDIRDTQTAIGRQLNARNPIVQIDGPLDDALIERLSSQALDLGSAEQPTATYHIGPTAERAVSIALAGTGAKISLLPEHFELIIQRRPQTTFRLQFDKDTRAHQAKANTQRPAGIVEQLSNPLTGARTPLHYTTDATHGTLISQALNAREFQLLRSHVIGLLQPNKALDH